MKVTLTEVLKDLRGLYDIEDRFQRFDAYRALAIGETRGEYRPIGTFSPMGERQADYLDRLLALDAERLARVSADEVAADFALLPDKFRLMLVVADESRNGWTERNLTDAQWRFTLKDDTLPRNVVMKDFDRWVTVLLWTDIEATEDYVKRETRAALYRALHFCYVGSPKTLQEMMQQEGRVLAYAGYTPTSSPEELAYSREVIQPHLQSSEFPVCFAALYGDEAARDAGYEPLGLESKAGFQLALADGLRQNDPERWLLQVDDSQHSRQMHL